MLSLSYAYFCIIYISSPFVLLFLGSYCLYLYIFTVAIWLFAYPRIGVQLQYSQFLCLTHKLFLLLRPSLSNSWVVSVICPEIPHLSFFSVHISVSHLLFCHSRYSRHIPWSVISSIVSCLKKREVSLNRTYCFPQWCILSLLAVFLSICAAILSIYYLWFSSLTHLLVSSSWQQRHIQDSQRRSQPSSFNLSESSIRHSYLRSRPKTHKLNVS